MLVTSNGQSDGEQVLILQIVGPHQETSVLTQLGDVPLAAEHSATALHGVGLTTGVHLKASHFCCMPGIEPRTHDILQRGPVVCRSQRGYL